MLDIFVPQSIRALLPRQDFSQDRIGMSQANVLLFPDRVLKIQDASQEARGEATMMRWLQDKIPVPELLGYEEADGTSYTVMTRISGEMACGEFWMGQPKALVRILAESLKLLWSTDISGCPADRSLDQKLALAAQNVALGLVDTDNVEPETFGPGGFRDPEALLHWLVDNRPPEEPVLSHGDFCLPNVFLNGNGLSGFIDLGRCGVADKWCDIAILCRSLHHNFSGYYDRRIYPGYDESQLFRELEIQPDPELLRYYILLDELF